MDEALKTDLNAAAALAATAVEYLARHESTTDLMALAIALHDAVEKRMQ